MGLRTTQHGVRKKSTHPRGPFGRGYEQAAHSICCKICPEIGGNVGTHARKFISHGGPQQERSPRTLGRQEPVCQSQKVTRPRVGVVRWGVFLWGHGLGVPHAGALIRELATSSNFARNPHQGKSLFFSSQEKMHVIKNPVPRASIPWPH